MKKVVATAAISLAMIALSQNALAQVNSNLDVGTYGNASGWTCDASNPGWQGSVVIVRDDNVLLAQPQANQPREPAVAAMCGGTASHGFSATWVPNSSLIDNKCHLVYHYFVKQDGQMVLLNGSPINKRFGADVSPGGSCPRP